MPYTNTLTDNNVQPLPFVEFASNFNTVKIDKKREKNPNIGVTIAEGIKKIRLKITSKGSGKSGGARVIIQELDIIIEEEDAKSILFVCIYDKSEYDSVDINIIKEIIEDFRKESSNTSSV